MSDMITAEEAGKLLDGTTLGPWEACGDGRRVKPVPLDLFFAPIAETHQAIRWVDGNWQREGGEVANARLIAAAPDLARTVIALHAQLADAQAAQALVLERAAEAADCGCKADKSDCLFMSGDVTFCYREGLPDIRALASPSGVEALAALRAERDAAIIDRDAHSAANRMTTEWLAQTEAERDDLRARLAAAEAQVGALVEAGEQWKAAHIALRDAGTMPEPKFFDMWAERRRKEDALIAALASAQGVKHD